MKSALKVTTQNDRCAYYYGVVSKVEALKDVHTFMLEYESEMDEAIRYHLKIRWLK